MPLVSRRPGDVPPPHNPEAEAGVLGAILQDSQAMPTAVENVRIEDFYVPANQKVMAAMIDLFEKGSAIDIITVADALRIRGDLESVGGMAYLTGLESQAKASSSVEYYSTIVREKSAVRRMIATASAIVSEGYSSEYEPADFLDRAEQAVFAAGDERLRSSERSLRDVLTDAVDRIEARVKRGGGAVTGIPTDYGRLDQLLQGFQNSDLIVIAARPSMGKTSFALNLAVNATCRGSNRFSLLFSSLEMSEAQVANRILCIYKRIDSHRLRSGFLAESEIAQFRAARDELAQKKLYIDDSPKLNVLELRAKARRMKAREELDMIMIDYLQLMEPVDKRISREQQISEISRSL
ncbi:MAG: replicative DNA helicase, partial [Deltaproteobacteria bacterium]|nr:replicative DNA helicase [Deltaproteobacteria bacterium]